MDRKEETIAKALAARILSIASSLDAKCHSEGCDGDRCKGCTDVRLQLDDDGSIEIHDGDPQYDSDHRGSWGSGFASRGMAESSARSVATDLLDQALDCFAQDVDGDVDAAVSTLLDAIIDSEGLAI